MLYAAELPQADFAKARLEHVILTQCKAPQSHWTGARMKNALLNLAELSDAHFEELRAGDSSWRGSRLERSHWQGAGLSRCDLGEARLAEMSGALWDAHAMAEGEKDRVVLSVELKAARDGETRWRRAWRMDAYGGPEGSAMARLVSTPVSLAVEAVMAGEIGPGVSAAPSDPELVARWLAMAKGIATYMEKTDIGPTGA